MKPITRKELYLNKIVGNNNYETPEKPITTEEFFFAEILGEAVQAPEPLTRYQMYLAKIAGREIEIPYPEVRLEYFLAKAAGMEIEIPTPITREEIFWSNYTAIVELEVEGVPPLTYKAIEGTLENYRIYGNTVAGESVGDLETTGEHAGEYKVPVTVSNGTDTLTTTIYLPEQIRKVGDEAEYIDYEEQKQHRVRKNLLLNTATSQTSNGVTFTVNNDKSITVNGTATATCIVPIGEFSGNGNYILGKGLSEDVRIDLRINNNMSVKVQSTTEETSFTSKNVTYTCCIRISKGYTYNNLTLCPMIRKADIEDDTYEPYITNTELDVTLPALPVLPGTNTLTVGTEVQPSKVYIKGQKERD